MQLVHQAARDAAASHSPALAQSLIAAVTQVAELAASLPPQAHAKQMQVNVPCTCPEDAAWLCKDMSVSYFSPEDSPGPNYAGFALCRKDV